MANIFDLFKQISTESSSKCKMEFILVGLGNPGDKYTRTRHNAGFLVLDRIAQKKGIKIDRSKFNALVAESEFSGRGVLLMKPQTFMNNSGEAVGAAARFYKIPPENIVVISDDITLDVGRLRLRRKGSSGGHNGLKSISAHLGTDDYPRIKVGVGAKPHADYDLVDWVLSSFSEEEYNKIIDAHTATYTGFEKIVSGEFDEAMQICNTKN